MYVCICHAVTEDDVAGAIDAGAASVAALGCATRAGASCAMCHDRLEELIEERCEACPIAAMQVA